VINRHGHTIDRPILDISWEVQVYIVLL